MNQKNLKLVIRDRHLTAEEVARDVDVRSKVMKEFPSAHSIAPENGAISDALRIAIRLRFPASATSDWRRLTGSQGYWELPSRVADNEAHFSRDSV